MMEPLSFIKDYPRNFEKTVFQNIGNCSVFAQLDFASQLFSGNTGNSITGKEVGRETGKQNTLPKNSGKERLDNISYFTE